MAFPLETFRLLYPAFITSDDALVFAVADQALCLADARGCACSDNAWLALTAHFLALRDAASVTGGGITSGAIASASVDKVSVSFQAPPSTDSWSHWLNLSPYGQQALAFIKACNAGGFYVGGLPERDAFKSVYGIRGGRG